MRWRHPRQDYCSRVNFVDSLNGCPAVLLILAAYSRVSSQASHMMFSKF